MYEIHRIQDVEPLNTSFEIKGRKYLYQRRKLFS